MPLQNTWCNRTFRGQAMEDEAAIQDYEDQSEEYLQEGEDLIQDYRDREQEYLDRIEQGFEDAPTIDLGEFDLGLQDIQDRTERGVGRYLSEGEERIQNMLDEINQGSQEYLDRYKTLSRTEMPGLDIFRDRAGSELAGGIQIGRAHV